MGEHDEAVRRHGYHALAIKRIVQETPDTRSLLGELSEGLAATDWQIPALEARLRDFVAAKGIKLGVVAQPLRAALTGSLASPGIFEVMEVLGRDETLGRLADAAESR